MNAREILIYLSLRFNGDYARIRQAIDEKDYPIGEDEQLPPIKSNVVTLMDEDYPEYLKKCPMPPFVLFYYGDLSLIKDFSNNIAVIGTRDFTMYGYFATKEIVKTIADKVNIVSGLARGIDSVAHRCALANNGKVIAVLGSGIDYCYPSSNKKIYEEIKRNHLVVSEYPNNVEPSPKNFPFRNRLIAMFSKAILVTEAYAHSGTSITVGYGLEIGKDILTIPFKRKSESFCNELIKAGAFLVENGQDVLELMDKDKNEEIFEN